MKAALGPAIAAALLLGGCMTATSGPVEVTRFHLGAPLERGSVVIESADKAPPGLEFATYAQAVDAELVRAGYSSAGTGAAQYLAVVGISRSERQGPPRQSGLSIGLGGGGYSGGVGLGGGITLPVGKRHGRELVFSELSVQLRRRSDGTVIWEGRAQTAADLGSPDAQAGATAAKLAAGLFQGFPGESGRTITVK